MKNKYGERYVQIGLYEAYPKGGGYWDVVSSLTGLLVVAWVTKEWIRENLIEE